MSQFALDLYTMMVENTIPIALTFGLCNLVVSWIFNAIFNRGRSRRDEF